MNAHTSRRDFLRSMGALVVAVSAPAPAFAAAAGAAKSMDPAEIDAWLAVAPDGMVTAFFGKPDVGQGVEVAIAQIVAEELDLPVERVQVHLADTGLTCDQGGVSGSTGVQRGGATLRNIAAEARRETPRCVTRNPSMVRPSSTRPCAWRRASPRAGSPCACRTGT